MASGERSIQYSNDKDFTNNEKKKKTWEKRIGDAKRKHRPQLKNWSKDRYATERRDDFHLLREPIDYSQRNYRIKPIEKVHSSSISVEHFLNRYEKQSIPLVIADIPETEGWKAHCRLNWTFDNLLKKYSNELFKCGEDDDGYKVNIKLKYFLSYLRNNTDDSPLYIFDSAYGDKKQQQKKLSSDILSDYAIPSYFPYDLFELVGEKRRPPYRWFLIGPERSGTTIHIDPLGTSAWNTLLVGRKRWILFPPDLQKDFVKGKEMMKKGEDDESINYFVDIFPRMKEKYLSVRNSVSVDSSNELFAYEFIQEAGDTIFVPSGWWHAVLNLEDTIAITHVCFFFVLFISFLFITIDVVSFRIIAHITISMWYGEKPEKVERKWQQNSLINYRFFIRFCITKR
jgi:histone arginine demethylase JMJD6